MFEALKADPALEAVILPVVVVDDTVLSEDVADSIIDALIDVPARRVELMQRATTQRELTALIGAIETYGLSRALTAFADYDGTLRAAVPAIPSLEAMVADLSVEDSAAVLTALKAIDFTAPVIEVDDEVADESLVILGVSLAIFAVVSLASAIYTGMLMWRGKKHWNTDKDDKEGRLAKVLPFGEISEYLKTVHELPHVAKALEALDLPKTDDELKAFVGKVDSISAPLKKFGVEVQNGDVRIIAFPKPIKKDIESIGYGEGSLAELADDVLKTKATAAELKAIDFKKHDAEWKAMTKEERRFGSDAHGLIEDVVVTAVHRMGKVIKLAKGTAKAIEHLYKA